MFRYSLFSYVLRTQLFQSEIKYWILWNSWPVFFFKFFPFIFPFLCLLNFCWIDIYTYTYTILIYWYFPYFAFIFLVFHCSLMFFGTYPGFNLNDYSIVFHFCPFCYSYHLNILYFNYYIFIASFFLIDYSCFMLLIFSHVCLLWLFKIVLERPPWQSSG